MTINARRCVLLAAAGVLCSPAASHAGVATVGPSAVSFIANSGETNHLFVVDAPSTVRMVDTGAPITAGPGCTAVSVMEVVCLRAPSPQSKVDIMLGDLDDFVTVGAGPSHSARLAGGDGDDTLEGGSSYDELSGGAGDDVLLGGSGIDTLDGGLGADILDGGSQAAPFVDVKTGTRVEEHDTVTYTDRVNPVTVTIDGVANDGESGEGDDVRNTVETVRGGRAADTLVASAVDSVAFYGGAGNDVLSIAAAKDPSGQLFGEEGDDHLTGSPLSESIDGGPGRDTLIGLDGRDFLSGGESADLLYGGAGSDNLYGGAGADKVWGERGHDEVIGGTGRDLLVGGRGRDTLLAQDGLREKIDGGPQRDRAWVDRTDAVRRVEVVKRPSR